MRRFVRLCALAAGSVALAACGSLDSNTNASPTLATVQGSLINPTSIGVSSTDAVRVAVVWRGRGPGQFNVAEDLPVRPVFPSSFTIALDGPPPEAAMNSEVPEQAPPQVGPSAGSGPSTGTGGPPPGVTGDDGGPAEDGAAPDGALAQSQPVSLLDTPAVTGATPLYAIGTVVAYLDLNHNGKLDLVADDATAYVDQILATNEELTLDYFEGTIPDSWPQGETLLDAAGHRPKSGYNVLRAPHCPSPPPTLSFGPNPACSNPPDAGSCNSTATAWLDISAPYPLTVASNPEVAILMCLEYDANAPHVGAVGSGPAGPYDPAVQPATYPDPCDPNLICLGDGDEYLFATCKTVVQGICKDTLLTCTDVGYERPTPTPAGWPCTH